MSGYALAAAWLWDALHDDALVPAGVTDDLANDLGAFAKSLMKVAPEYGIDLCIRDADGRLTSFHDLNPRQLSPTGVLPATSTLQNGFNAALALGVIRAAYHVTGDHEIGRYYYDELVGKRDFPHLADEFSGIVFVGAMTNYSNVNMLAIALATIGRFETDTDTLSTYDDTLATQFWSTGSDYDVSHVKQAWFDVIWGGFSSKATADVAARMTADLGGFQPAPAIERDLVNCDPTEIAAGVCTAVDGTTQIVLASGMGHGGSVEAKDIVPMSVRPDTDFAWRSDPHDVNGTASTLMDPRGDWLTAYWLGRLFELAAPEKNRSPFARPPLSYTRGEGGGGGAGGASPAASSSGSGGAGSLGDAARLRMRRLAGRGGRDLAFVALFGVACWRSAAVALEPVPARRGQTLCPRTVRPDVGHLSRSTTLGRGARPARFFGLKWEGLALRPCSRKSSRQRARARRVALGAGERGMTCWLDVLGSVPWEWSRPSRSALLARACSASRA